MNEKQEKSGLDKFDFVSLMNIGRSRKNAPDPKYANFNRRMMAATLDSFLAMIFMAPIIDYFFMRTYGPVPIDIGELHRQLGDNPGDPEAALRFWQTLYTSGYIQRWVSNAMWQFSGMLAMSAVCWHFWSATPGKMIMRIRVADRRTEGRINDLQIVMRLAGYLISGMALFMGFFWIGLDRKRQGWHDKLADTVVLVVPWRRKAEAGVAEKPAEKTVEPLPET